MPQHLGRLGLSLLALLAAGCSSVAAAAVANGPTAADAPVPSAHAAVAAAPAVPQSVAIVQRMEAQSATAVPAVVGADVDAAVDALQGVGATVQIVKLQASSTMVSAQWPEAGSPVPSDAVVIWLGDPPTLPRSANVRPVAPASETPAAAPKPGFEITESAPTELSTEVTSPVSGKTPGLEGFVAPPHPPRANIRTLDPAPAGTTLAGRASWYGPGFDGHQTACGGIFDSSQLTIASRELRCGTTVDVSGPGGTVRATVTDWGPAEWTARRFDLSRATFEAVASLSSGVVDVTITVAG